MSLNRALIGFAMSLLLTACATQSPRHDAWMGRAEDAPKLPSVWSFEGRIAISNGSDSGSGRIRWQQQGEAFTIGLRAPISGQSWELVGRPSCARIEGLRPEAVEGRSARELLTRELGWSLPDGTLHAWLFGQGFGAQAQMRRDEAGQLSEVRDQGWVIVYKNWRLQNGFMVPGKIDARRPPHKLRLAIQQWDVSSDANAH